MPVIEITIELNCGPEAAERERHRLIELLIDHEAVNAFKVGPVQSGSVDWDADE